MLKLWTLNLKIKNIQHTTLSYKKVSTKGEWKISAIPQFSGQILVTFLLLHFF